MSEPDELYTLRNLFWIGNYQLAINEANGLNRLPAALVPEKEEFVYRSYLALGQYHILLGEIKDNSSTPISLRALKLLASYFSDPSTKEAALSQVQEWLQDPVGSGNTKLQMVAAILYMHDDNLKDAIKSVRNAANMEQHGLLVQLYLRMDRLDLAQKQVKLMKSLDEDGVLTMLASAWTTLATGGAKVQDAAYIYDELIDKYGGSALLLSSLAVAKMHLTQFEEAETLLQEALNKSPSDPDSLANLIVVSQHLLRTPEVVTRYIAQLRLKAPRHTLLTSLGTFETAFDRVAATIKA